MGRRAALALAPAAALALAWLSVERPAEWRRAGAMVVLAAASALPGRAWQRLAAALAAAVAGLALALESPLAEPRAALDELWRGLAAFYEIALPFDPARDPEMSALVLVSVLGLGLCVAQLAAAGWTLPAAVVTAAGIAWPPTLRGGDSDLAWGALALVAVLWLLVLARRRPPRAVLGGALAGMAVVAAAVAAAGSGAGAREAGLDWKRWELFSDRAARVAVSYVWDANYEGISFPTKATPVLRIRADRRSRYWRASTLDLFADDRWLEDLRPLGFARGSGLVPADGLTPPAARRRSGWLEQRVEIDRLRDTRLVAAGTPTAFDVRTHGTALLAEGGGLRVPVGLRRGDRYSVWSYVPDPVPRALAAAPATYPAAAGRFLTAFGEEVPPFREPGREAASAALLAEPRAGAAYGPLWERARRLAGAERSPYRVVLALESWLRSRGGFRYDERPPQAAGVPPLVGFLTTTKAGYCQQFAGSMALMLRLLGIPSRVAVGFTSGDYRDGTWVVTDLDAHAWVEVWFPGYGWVPFDPTPGRGSLSGAYSFASESAQAVAALGAGRLPGAEEVARLTTPPAAREGAGDGGAGGPLLGLLAAVLLGSLAALVGWKALRARVRYLSRDPRRRAAAARAELVGFLRDQGLDVGQATTVSDLRASVRAAYGVRLDPFADAFGRARFARAPLAADAARARAELRRALAALRGRLGVRRRLLGAVSTRSLRDG